MFRSLKIPEGVWLIGDFRAELTSQEANQWCEFIRGHPERIKYDEAKIECVIAEARIKGGDLSEQAEKRMHDAGAALTARNHQLYEIAKTWYAGLSARDESNGETK